MSWMEETHAMRSEVTEMRTEMRMGFARLETLIERGLVAGLARRPGQKEQRYTQLLGGGEDSELPPAAADEGQSASLEARVEQLEEQVRRLQAALESLS